MDSFLISIVATFFSTLVAISGAYSISRFTYKGRAMMIFLILLTQMLPFVLLIIPIYRIFAKLHLNNTLYALMIIYTAITVPIGVWFLKGFFDAIPKDLEEAAIIDGCRRSLGDTSGCDYVYVFSKIYCKRPDSWFS